MQKVPRRNNQVLWSAIPSLISGLTAIDAALPPAKIPTVRPTLEAALNALIAVDSVANTPANVATGYLISEFQWFYSYAQVAYAGNVSFLADLETAMTNLVSLCSNADFLSSTSPSDFSWNYYP